MRKSNKDVWPLLDNQVVKIESAVDKLKRLIKESQDIRNFKFK